jgi:hypothetical protein
VLKQQDKENGVTEYTRICGSENSVQYEAGRSILSQNISKFLGTR